MVFGERVISWVNGSELELVMSVLCIRFFLLVFWFSQFGGKADRRQVIGRKELRYLYEQIWKPAQLLDGPAPDFFYHSSQSSIRDLKKARQ